MRWWVCACSSDLFLFSPSPQREREQQYWPLICMWVCASSSPPHLSSSEHTGNVPKKRLNEKEKDRQRGRGNIQSERERERANSIVRATAARCHFWRVSRRSSTHFWWGRRAYIRATHRVKLAVKVCCAPDVTIVVCQWAIHCRWSSLLFQSGRQWVCSFFFSLVRRLSLAPVYLVLYAIRNWFVLSCSIQREREGTHARLPCFQAYKDVPQCRSCQR